MLMQIDSGLGNQLYQNAPGCAHAELLGLEMLRRKFLSHKWITLCCGRLKFLRRALRAQCKVLERNKFARFSTLVHEWK